MRDNKKGFTVIELMAVIAIGIVLMAMTIGTAMGMRHFYSRRETVKELKDIGCALLRYQMDMDSFPAGEDRSGLRRLWDPQASSEWFGPYTAPDMQNALTDGWHHDYIYRRGQNTRGTEVALILSRGKDGKVNSNLARWVRDDWQASGDDIAWKLSASWNIKDKEGLTQESLKREAGSLIARHPEAAPAAYTPELQDAFENRLVYVRCNDSAAFLLSQGANGVNDSNLCQRGSPSGDDLAVSLEWSPNAAPQVVTPPPPPPPPRPPQPRPWPRPRTPLQPPPRDPCP